MNLCYTLKLIEFEIQKEDDVSFIGGVPRLPLNISIPTCNICGKQQSFFFQVAFPEEHIWSGFSMALFHCTSCANRDYFIPEMLKPPLYGADIPKGFLEQYQRNFKIIIFETDKSVLRRDYIERIVFHKWDIEKTKNSKIKEDKIGGVPNWLLEDESPLKYDSGTSMFFLMQILQDFKFDILPEAPRQMKLGLSPTPQPSNNPFYRLFLENNIYFFGTESATEKLVYIITQI